MVLGRADFWRSDPLLQVVCDTTITGRTNDEVDLVFLGKRYGKLPEKLVKDSATGAASFAVGANKAVISHLFRVRPATSFLECSLEKDRLIVEYLTKLGRDLILRRQTILVLVVEEKNASRTCLVGEVFSESENAPLDCISLEEVIWDGVLCFRIAYRLDTCDDYHATVTLYPGVRILCLVW